MAFCSYCGSELAPGARFCASCGSPISAALPGSEPDPVPVMPLPEGPAEYSLVLYSIGTCARSYADDVLEDVLGYTDSEAKQLVRLAPTEIAQLLTAQQAQYIAQALTEYGMQVLVYRGQSPVDLGQYATRSVYNTDGSFVSGVMTALATITLANRIRAPRRRTLGDVLQNLFAPRYRYTPPRHVTRAPIRREPAPIVRTPEPRRTVPSRRLEPQRRAADVPRSVELNRQTRGFGGGSPRGGGHGGPGGPGGRR